MLQSGDRTGQMRVQLPGDTWRHPRQRPCPLPRCRLTFLQPTPHAAKGVVLRVGERHPCVGARLLAARVHGGHRGLSAFGGEGVYVIGPATAVLHLVGGCPACWGAACFAPLKSPASMELEQNGRGLSESVMPVCSRSTAPTGRPPSHPSQSAPMASRCLVIAP